MVYTSHGHHISGTILNNQDPNRPQMMRCGGPTRCRECRDESTAYYLNAGEGFQQEELSVFTTTHDGVDHQEKAKRAVIHYINQGTPWIDVGRIPPVTINNVFVTWWSKTLDNWKAVVVTNVVDGMYYELTYNGAKNEIYIDVYRKLDNVVVVPV